jgi:hypothetical protein
MTRARLLAASTIAAAALLFSACEDVPSLRFADGGSNDGGEADDAGDARARDAAGEASATTCPTTPPLGAGGCCDTVPCAAGSNCDPAQCKAKNCDTCAPGQYCCTAGNGRCIAPTELCK